MYLSELQIEGYKGFRELFSISLKKGLNVIVGDLNSVALTPH